MPFFWKKKKKTGEKKEAQSKINRISRLVSDLNSKRDSLVQTGFPTSVAGLVVNSNISWIPPIPERKKVSKKPYKKPSINGTSPPFLDLPAIHISTPVVKFERPCWLEPGSIRLPVEEPRTDTKPLISIETDGDLLPTRKQCKVRPLIFLLSALALVTKKLTLAVTILAFLMFFVKYVGKHFCDASKLCIVKSKSEGNSHQGKSSFEGINTRWSECYWNREINEPVPVSLSMETSSRDLVGRNEDTDALGSRRDEPMTLKQWMLQEEDGEETIPKMNQKNELKAKLLKKLCAKSSCSSKYGDFGERVEPLPDEISVSDWLQDAHKIEEEKEKLLSLEGDILPYGTERNDIKEWFSIIRNLNLRNLISISVILSGLVGGRLIALLVTTTWYLLANCRQAAPERCRY